MRRLLVLALALLAGCGEPVPLPLEQPKAAPAGDIPAGRLAPVGGVKVPAGQPIGEGMWATDDSPPEAFELWSRLAAAFPETGLWPVLLELPADELEISPNRGWQRD